MPYARNALGHTLEQPCGSVVLALRGEYCDEPNYLAWRTLAVALRRDVIADFSKVEPRKREALMEWLQAWGKPAEAGIVSIGKAKIQLGTKADPTTDVDLNYPQDPGIMDADWFGYVDAGTFASVTEALARYLERGLMLSEGTGIRFDEAISDATDAPKRGAAGSFTTALAVVGGATILGGTAWAILRYYSRP